MSSVIERVILLQAVDVFEGVSSEQLAHVAAIAHEVSHPAGTVLFHVHDASDAMFVVVEGEVRLSRGPQVVTVARAGEAFGTWSLFDDEPRVVDAEAASDVTLLRLDRADFIDLLADNVEITQGILKGIVQRLRGVAGRLVSDGS